MRLRVPLATYRLQFNSNFRFKKFVQLPLDLSDRRSSRQKE